MHSKTKLLSTISSGVAFAAFFMAAPAFADGTADCNTGAVDPTSLECGIAADADGSDALAVGTEAIANGTYCRDSFWMARECNG